MKGLVVVMTCHKIRNTIILCHARSTLKFTLFLTKAKHNQIQYFASKNMQNLEKLLPRVLMSNSMLMDL